MQKILQKITENEYKITFRDPQEKPVELTKEEYVSAMRAIQSNQQFLVLPRGEKNLTITRSEIKKIEPIKQQEKTERMQAKSVSMNKEELQEFFDEQVKKIHEKQLKQYHGIRKNLEHAIANGEQSKIEDLATKNFWTVCIATADLFKKPGETLKKALRRFSKETGGIGGIARHFLGKNIEKRDSLPVTLKI